MSSNKPKESHASDDFVLKHRIAGAAFLLFFGAVVLPLLLGPPSQASKTPRAVELTNNGNEISSADIENELLGQTVARDDSESEQVYISKITPLDADRLNEEAGKSESATESGDTKAETTSESEKKAESAKVNSAKKESDKTGAGKVVKKAEPETAKPRKETNRTEKENQRAAELAAALEAESKKASTANSDTAKIDVGWVVQVGVFTDKKGAAKVVEDLASKGFEPFTSIVDTNRGKATGTRVWLGPFAQRVEAAKTKTLLTERTGEPGFIRAYP